MNGRPKRQPLFCGYWIDVQTGAKLERATVDELREANRLWWVHRDIRRRCPSRAQERRIARDPAGRTFVPFAGITNVDGGVL